ncbi:hypothetical protein DE146DRAFT_263002 [Phaeosphaeria sp. MPI-PUGE-AT-0046c]|nr:hypothetical protein DE146DRAFT_263002 [Phaeosphaeria sp. MPI-PUGE-AT-0046c]
MLLALRLGGYPTPNVTQLCHVASTPCSAFLHQALGPVVWRAGSRAAVAGWDFGRWVYHATRARKSPSATCCLPASLRHSTNYDSDRLRRSCEYRYMLPAIQHQQSQSPVSYVSLTWDPRHNYRGVNGTAYSTRAASWVRINGMRSNGIQPHRPAAASGLHIARWDLFPHIMHGISNCSPCSCKMVLFTGSVTCAISTLHDSSGYMVQPS